MIGMNYFFDNKSNSPYIIAAIGKTKSELDENGKVTNYNGNVGQSYKVGLGYELKNWYVEATYIKAKSENTIDKIKSNAYLIGIGYNFYRIFGIR